MAGRGAYLHDRYECWERGVKGALAHALKTELSDEERSRLMAFAATLPPAEDEADSSPNQDEPAND